MKKRYLLSAMGILRLVWLVSLIVREATLSRADLDPFLRLFFSFLLAIILMESSLASKKLSFFGNFAPYVLLPLGRRWVFADSADDSLGLF